MRELGEKYGLVTPAPGDGTFSTFLRLYAAACETLRHRDDMERLVREVAEDAASDGAIWIELAEWPRPGAAERLGGNEAAGPPEPFAEAFAIARSARLISAPHAGEQAGPDSVRAALDALGAQRIEHGVRAALDALGAQRIEHGVRAVEDPRLVERLAREQVCLDVCPTSNVHLRVVPSLRDHPLARVVEAGVPVSLNADDPLMFGSGHLQKYELARDVLGLDDETLAAIAATSIRASGAPVSVKSAALEGVGRWLRGASPVTSQPNISGVGLHGGASPT